MEVKDLMTQNVHFVKDTASVNEAIILMKKYNIGIVPVCDNTGTILGLITDRDIVLRALIIGSSDLSLIKASEIMTDNLQVVSPNTSIHDAALLFSKEKKHRLPVVENSKLVGILSISDLAKKKIFLAEVGDIFGSLSKY